MVNATADEEEEGVARSHDKQRGRAGTYLEGRTLLRINKKKWVGIFNILSSERREVLGRRVARRDTAPFLLANQREHAPPRWMSPIAPHLKSRIVTQNEEPQTPKKNKKTKNELPRYKILEGRLRRGLE